jgi:hypothetical protein
MSISNENVKQIFTGDNSNTTFPFSIVYFDADEIKVYLRDESVSPATETLLTDITDYALTDGTDDGYRIDGGTVEMVVAPASTEKLIVIRELNLRQDDFNPSPTSAYQPEQVEVTFDRLVAMAQQLDEQLDRTVKTSPGSGISNLELPVAANKFIKWNSSGTALITEAIDLTTLQSDLDSAESNINTNAFAIAQLALRVTANEGAISALQLQDVTLANQIGVALSGVANNLASIGILQAQQVLFNNRLNALEDFLGTSGNQTILNNTADQVLTDMIFDGLNYSAIVVEFAIRRDTDTANKVCQGLLYLVFSNYTGTWRVEKGVEALDYAGVTFTMPNTVGKIGQVKMTSNDLAGTSYSGKIYYNIKKFEV